jgi:hypothetical protein
LSFFLIEDFRAGLDVRKAADTSPAGTLTQFENAHVSSGGEVEKRLAFDSKYTLPANTFGLCTLDSEIYVFGTIADPLTGTHVNTTYVQLTTSSSALLSSMVDWDVYDGLLYVVFELADGVVDHFYDGALVTGAAGKGRYVKTFQTKTYSVIAKTLNFSATGNTTDWAGTGSGFINLAQQDARGVDAVGLEVYFNRLAVFGRRVIYIWNLDVDPLNNALEQTLQQTGTLASRSVAQFGNGDVLYLGDSGLRSLRARDSSNAAAVSDIGSPIDPLLVAAIQAAGEATTSLAQAIVEPVTGRFWLILNDKIYVLSYFPGPKITAWSTYTPGITFDHVAVLGNNIVGRAGDEVYTLGGTTGEVYDTAQTRITTPFLAITNPSTTKVFQGLDVACIGTWTVGIALDPFNPVYETVATITNSTYRTGRIELGGSGTHISAQLTCTDASAASVANVGVHYTGGETG